jgi:hypothetical protein
VNMDDKRSLMRHSLAALAYRTQKALRGTQPSFASFRAAPPVRTPHELVRHMSGVLNYAPTFFGGDPSLLDTLPNFEAEIARFHQILEELGEHLLPGTPLRGVTPEQLLQGPFADAMTHAGQLAMLRRLPGDPIPPENFLLAEVHPENLGPNQAQPASSDVEWPARAGGGSRKRFVA